MKLTAAHVDNFGCLHDFDYSFDAGMNLFLHENGWGKTTFAAFLKAMFYGFEKRLVKDVTRNERLRYSPWQGGTYGGSLDLETKSGRFRIIREFGETGQYDKTRFINLSTGKKEAIAADQIGEALFRLDANAFQRSVFITQNGLTIENAQNSINNRLNALVNQVNDSAAYTAAKNRLDETVKDYRRKGGRGRLPELTQEISEKEKQLLELQSAVEEQQAGKDHIAEIQRELGNVSAKLNDKRTALERLTGEAAANQTSSHIIDERRQEIEQSLRYWNDELEELTDYYSGWFPTIEELDKIQQLYRELQGLEASADVEDDYSGESAESHPKHFKRILIPAGIALLVLGIIAALLFSPVFVALACLGLGVLLVGIAENKKEQIAIAVEQERQKKIIDQQKRHSDVNESLNEALSAIQGLYEDLSIPERVAHVRNDVADVARFKEKIRESEEEQEKLLKKQDTEPLTIEDIESRKKELQEEIQKLQDHRENLLMEITRETENVRKLDESLETLQNARIELQELKAKKHKSETDMEAYQRASELMSQAKENLAFQYIRPLEVRFNEYLQIWLEDEDIRGKIDSDLGVSIMENKSNHQALGYSTGYCDIIDFCMRLALVDTLYDDEKPFLVLDDPFVAMDEKHLAKAMDLLQSIAGHQQILYFVCHPLRAAAGNELNARTSFESLSGRVIESAGTQKPVKFTGLRRHADASRKGRYKVVETGIPVQFAPADPSFVIRNSIFTMHFMASGSAGDADVNYILFFTDDKGRVLSDKQKLRVKEGKLAADSVQFSINTKEDSGNELELMVQEDGQKDYEIVARYPVRADMTFASVFSFDL